jgi:hypothetical protein
MAHPTTLDILLTRLSAIEARLAALEAHAASGVAVSAGCSELEAALAKLGTAVKRADGGPDTTGESCKPTARPTGVCGRLRLARQTLGSARR